MQQYCNEKEGIDLHESSHNRKKWWVFFLLGGLLWLGLVACSAPKPSEETTNNENQVEGPAEHADETVQDAGKDTPPDASPSESSPPQEAVNPPESASKEVEIVVEDPTPEGPNDETPVENAPSDEPSSNKSCSFNRDCPSSAERCECSETEGCACKRGLRGTGKVGQDKCQSGNDCESAICLEGKDDILICSGPCKTAQDCPPALPLCSNVAFVGQICIRKP